MAIDKSINITLENNLCLSCEICKSVCPENAISMDFDKGRLLPVVDKKRCTNCGICLKFCPGIDIDKNFLKSDINITDLMVGRYLDCYSAYSKDNKIRINSTSGGMITTLVKELISGGRYEAVFSCDLERYDPAGTRLKKMSVMEDIFKSAKSKYIPASVYNIIEELKNYKGQKYIIVATPCMTYAIKKYIKNKRIDDSNLLFFGLFCEKVLNLNIINYFEYRYGKKNERIDHFYYKYKDKTGWPGDVRFSFDDGRTMVLPSSEREKLKRFFQLERCIYCIDKLNKYSDISFGDCYIKGQKDHLGRSSVIIRTPRGREVFNRYSYLFNLKEEDISEIMKSQKIMARAKNLDNIKWFYFNHTGLLKKSEKIYLENPEKIDRKFTSIRKHIGWGESQCFKRIDSWFFITGFRDRIFKCLRKIKGLSGNIIKVFIIMFEGIVKYGFINNPENREIENIFIVGGNLINKGAQAMTFTVVNKLREKGFKGNIFLMSSKDYYDNYNVKDIYNFDFLPWDLDLKIRILNPRVNYILGLGKKIKIKDKILNGLNSGSIFIDVSGYALSTQWGIIKSLNYLLNIIIARRYGIKFYIMPQSVGPFRFPRKAILWPLLRLYMRYPAKIYIREEQGINSIIKYASSNIIKSSDMVLINQSYCLNNIFKKRIRLKNISLKKKAISIIPNLNLTRIMEYQKVIFMYKKIIKKLLKDGYIIYIFNHSSRDLSLSMDIKRVFLNNKDVLIITDNLNAIELERIIKQSDFLIASRYHSIVHAYKNYIPAIIIGWAVKYQQLARDFEQIDYFFDLRNREEIEGLEKAVENIMKNLKEEKRKIEQKIIQLRKADAFESIFDFIS